MDIIVVGAGKVGSLLTELLSQEGHRVVAIDSNERKLAEIQDSLDVLCLQGSAVEREVLAEAGAGSADIVIAATDSDETNMLCCLIARKLGALHTIARVRKPELAEEIDLFSEDMGLSLTINPELYAAQEIFSVLRYPGLASVETFGHGAFELVELRLKDDCPATSMPLQELAVKYRSKALVCAIRRGDSTIIPGGSDTLMPGDSVSFAAEPKEVEHFLNLCGIKSRMPVNVIIMGAGQITYYLVRMMREVGMQPKIIEKDLSRAQAMAKAIPDVMVLYADGTNRDVLDEEGIDRADAFISLTGTDEINILAGMYSQLKGVPKVVTKISRSSMSDLIAPDSAGSIVCPRDIVSERVISYVRASESAGDSNIETLYNIAGDTAEAVEFRVLSEHKDLTGIPLKDLSIRDNVLLCSIMRDGSVIIPRGGDTIEPGDHVVIVTTIKQITDLSMILR